MGLVLMSQSLVANIKLNCPVHFWGQATEQGCFGRTVTPQVLFNYFTVFSCCYFGPLWASMDLQTNLRTTKAGPSSDKQQGEDERMSALAFPRLSSPFSPLLLLPCPLLTLLQINYSHPHLHAER